jgi:hypothetical protein
MPELLTFAGINIALATLFAYKMLKSGEKKNMYDQSTRLHGKIMLGLGVIRPYLIFWIRCFLYQRTLMQ